MAKFVELTWRTKTGTIIVEQCYLLADDDPVYMPGVDEPIVVITEDGVGNTVESFSGGMVMFEDDFGLFGVPPQDVINIKELEPIKRRNMRNDTLFVLITIVLMVLFAFIVL